MMEQKQQKSTINALYIFLVISTVLSFVPYISAQIMAFALVFVTLTAAYIYRGKDAEGGLLHNHMTYMIGTIWIGGGFLLLGFIALGLALYARGDHSVVYEAMQAAQSGIIANQDDMQRLTLSYITANKDLIIMSSFVFLGPPMLYFIYRVANGYGRAMKGYRIAKPKSWL